MGVLQSGSLGCPLGQTELPRRRGERCAIPAKRRRYPHAMHHSHFLPAMLRAKPRRKPAHRRRSPEEKDLCGSKLAEVDRYAAGAGPSDHTRRMAHFAL